MSTGIKPFADLSENEAAERMARDKVLAFVNMFHLCLERLLHSADMSVTVRSNVIANRSDPKCSPFAAEKSGRL